MKTKFLNLAIALLFLTTLSPSASTALADPVQSLKISDSLSVEFEGTPNVFYKNVNAVWNGRTRALCYLSDFYLKEFLCKDPTRPYIYTEARSLSSPWPFAPKKGIMISDTGAVSVQDCGTSGAISTVSCTMDAY